MRMGLMLAALAALAGCASPVVYECDDGREITARYGENPPALLEVDGKSYPLYQVVSASGARYASERGLTPETGIIWWTKGDEATLYEMILDHTVSAEDYPVLAQCAERDLIF